MNKLTRLIAVSITSLIAVGALAAPAMAVEEPGDVETAVCDAVGPLMVDVAGAIEAGNNLVAAQAAAVEAAKTDLDSSSALIGTTGLAYVRALDTDTNVEGTLDDFVDAVGVFSEDVATWVDAVDEQADNTIDTGLNEALLTYLEGLCPTA